MEAFVEIVRGWYRLDEIPRFALTLLGVCVLIVALLVAGWFRYAWIANVLHNHLDAKRRRRRGEPPKRPGTSN